MRVRFGIPRPPAWGGVRPWLVGAVWIVVGAALVAIVFATSFYVAMRGALSASEVRVPAFVGQTFEEADRAAHAAGVVLQVVDQRHDPAMSSGRILQQVPPTGASVRRGRKVKLVLSLGGRVLEVPSVVGSAARAVQIELRGQGFGIGDDAHAFSTRTEAGRILAQVPPPGAPAVPGTRVHLLVSDGPSPRVWVMPDLTGVRAESADRWIASSGLRRGAVRRVSMIGRPANTVIGQSPLAGYPVREKDVVELTVAQ